MDTGFQSKLATRVAFEQSRNRVPGLTVAVGVGGTAIAEASAGFADVENRVPVSHESRFRIGSITKTFTAALTLLLCRSGDLSLDGPVEQVLPDTPFGRISLRMLLAHNSGLQREAPMDMWESMQGPTGPELLDTFGHVEAVAEPGRRWHYSNLGYAVIGQIIEKVTGRSCADAIQQLLLDPLKLTHTTWTTPADGVVGYRRDPYADKVFREPIMDQGAIGVGGQLWSTPSDLLRWGNALCGAEPEVLPPSIVDAMHTPHVMVDTRTWTRGWGLGLSLDRREECVLAGHTGAMPGFQSALSLDRDTGTVVVALANATHGMPLGELAIDIALEAIAGLVVPTPPAWEAAPPCPWDTALLLGSWWSESEEIVFRWERDGLHAFLATDPTTSDTRFAQEAPGRFRAIVGRLQGELLLVSESDNDEVVVHWATYPLTRTPR